MTFDDSLDITALKNALEAYRKMITFMNKMESKPVEEIDEYEEHVIQAALSQHFKFSYELCWKFMKRFIEREGVNVGLSKRNIFRESLAMELIKDFDEWVKYTEARNETSHTYDEAVADEVAEVAKVFFPEFERFVKTLESKL